MKQISQLYPGHGGKQIIVSVEGNGNVIVMFRFLAQNGNSFWIKNAEYGFRVVPDEDFCREV